MPPASYSRLVFAAFSAVLFLGANACDPGQVPPSPTGGCFVDGKVYRPGDSFPSPDGCNSCSCSSNGQVACTLKACIDGGAGPGPACVYQGKGYAAGDSFPAADGCNTCTCGANGSVGCTKKGCPPPSATACKRAGCTGHICSDKDVITTCEFRPEYACYKSATCERQADGACGFTKTPELASCLKGTK